MIKSLFDYDEEEKPQPKENISETAETEEAIKRQMEELNLQTQMPAAGDETETITQIRPTESGATFAGEDDEIETVTLPKIEQIYANANEPPPVDKAFLENQFFENEAQTPEASPAELTPAETEQMPAETEQFQQLSPPTPYRNVLQTENTPTVESVSQTENAYQTDNVSQTASIFQAENVSQNEARPLTTAETIRQSGMAWSAAVGLFGSILFMMILGWFFDLLTGASPIGLVGGIIVGSAIGFYQFFRTTSQIFKK